MDRAEEWERATPKGPKALESTAPFDNRNARRKYDSYKPEYDYKTGYDSYTPSTEFFPQEQPLVPPRRRPTIDEYWDQDKDRRSSDLFVPASIDGPTSHRQSESSAQCPDSMKTSGRIDSPKDIQDRSIQQEQHEAGKEHGTGGHTPFDKDNHGSRGQAKRPQAENLRINTNGSRSSSKPLPSGVITPQSVAMDLDPPASAKTRPSEQTPTGRISFTMPASSEFNPSADKTAAVSSLKVLINNLSHFAQSVTEAASLTIRRDTAQAKMEKTERENRKWHSQRGDFTSLVEEQAKEMRKIKDTMDRIDEKLLKLNKAKDEAIQTMTTAILAVTTSPSLPVSSHGDDNVPALKTELKTLRAEIALLTDKLHSLEQNTLSPKLDEGATNSVGGNAPSTDANLENIRAKTRQIPTLQSGLGKLEVQVGRLTHDFDNLRPSLVTYDQFRTLQKQLEGLQEKFKATKSTGDRVPNLETEMSTLSKSLDWLKEEIIGSGEDDSGNDRKGRINQLQADFLIMKKELVSLGESIVTQESNSARLASVSNSETEATFTRIGQLFQKVDDELEQLRTEQMTKDDLVGQEVERLDNSLKSVDALLSDMRNKLDAQVPTSSSKQPQLDNLVSPQSRTTPQVNGIGSHEQTAASDTNVAQPTIWKEYNDRLVVCETAYRDLQYRFDNLSTADLARNMAHQMASMYPYPAAVLGQLDQLTRNYLNMAQSIPIMNSNLNALEKQRVDGFKAQAAMLLIQKQKIEELDKTIVSLWQRTAPAATTTTQIPEEQVINKEFLDLKSQVTELSNTLEANSRELKDISDTLERAKEQYQSTVEPMQSKIQEIEDDIVKKVGLSQYEEKVSDFNLKTAEILDRMNEKESTAAEELAILHVKMKAVRRHLGFLDEESEDESKKTGFQPDTASSTRTVILGTPMISSSEDSDPPRDQLGRSMLQKRKDQKRKRQGAGSDSDFNPRRKTRI